MNPTNWFILFKLSLTTINPGKVFLFVAAIDHSLHLSLDEIDVAGLLIAQLDYLIPCPFVVISIWRYLLVAQSIISSLIVLTKLL